MQDSNAQIAVVLGVGLVAVAAVISASVVSASKRRRQKEEQARMRADSIRRKYGNNEISDKIIKKSVWVGETAEQLRDSLGPPADIDQKVLKTKKKEVWKYFETGYNRYGLRITLDNDAVVGWDEKLT